jgi:hypothetical protein
MVQVMSGTPRISGGLLHCNMTYMRSAAPVVKMDLLQRNRKMQKLISRQFVI